MASNKIGASMPFKTVNKQGQQLAVAVSRGPKNGLEWSKYVALNQRPAMETALIKDEGLLPPGTAQLVARDGAHSSSNDLRSHYTLYCYDAKHTFIKTVHIPVENGRVEDMGTEDELAKTSP
ncbi:hypothetical protein MMC29_006405 [Sticta canariensis]|nr:hypothetical protein [Sticta canariensis]